MSIFVCAGCQKTIKHGQCVVELRNGYYDWDRMEIPWDETSATVFLHAGSGEEEDQPSCLSLSNLRLFIGDGGLFIRGFNG